MLHVGFQTVTCVNWERLSNAVLPMCLTLTGIVTLVNPLLPSVQLAIFCPV